MFPLSSTFLTMRISGFMLSTSTGDPCSAAGAEPPLGRRLSRKNTLYASLQAFALRIGVVKAPLVRVDTAENIDVATSSLPTASQNVYGVFFRV